MLVPISTDILEGAKLHLNSTEEFLEYLRSRGVSKIKSVMALAVLGQRTLDEAKSQVQFSHAWADRENVDASLQEAAFKALRPNPVTKAKRKRD